MTSQPRIAVRAIILHKNRLLLVNAWPGRDNPLLCAPGGGVDRGHSLPDNLVREVYEETGLKVQVGAPCLVNEFHDPGGKFHQVDVYFRCWVSEAHLDETWKDPEGIVHTRRWVSRAEMADLKVKPDSLADVAWGTDGPAHYDPLEPIIR